MKFPALLALAALLSLALSPLPAHAVRVTGTVVDGAGKPVELATLAIPTLKLGTVTDEQGRFELELAAGTVMIEVSEIGYERRRIEVRVAEEIGRASCRERV